MDTYSDAECEELRCGEPVALESSRPGTATPLLYKKPGSPPSTATSPVQLPPTIAPQGANGVATTALLPSSPPSFQVLAKKVTGKLPVDPLSEIAGVESREPHLESSGTELWRLQLHELFLQADQSQTTSSFGSPHSTPQFFNESPTSSNSSDGSSLFGSPRALSSGARSTSSDFYGCDSTSSSRDVSPFGSPSGDSYPLFRFAFPKDVQQPLNVLDLLAPVANSIGS